MDTDDIKNNYFNVHLCHVCKSKDSFKHSKCCSACKLISYCSKEHQKADRANHKSICQAAQKVCRAVGGDDVFDAGIIAVFARRKMKDLMSEIHHPDFPPKSERTKVKITTSQMIQKFLVRPMERFEQNMIYFPKHCALCFTRKNIEKKSVCTDCFGVAYCSVEHQIVDNHREVCSNFQKVLDTDLFMLNVNLESPGVPKIPSDKATNIQLDALDMKSFIEKYITPGLKFEEEALISIYYTRVLTFAYIVNRISNFKLGERLTIHIIGAHASYEGRVVEYWENLLHLFPKIFAITLVHVGPGISGPPAKLKLCDDCNSAKRSVDALFYEQRYHEYHHYSCVVKKPDVIVAFNSGLYDHDPSYNPWGPSLPLFFKYDNVPVILTEAFKYEAEKDLERLLSLDVIHNKKVRVVVECEENPFKNLSPRRDWTDSDFSVLNQDSYVSALIVESG